MPVYQYIADSPWRYYYSTRSTNEDGWRNEGVAFFAYTWKQPGTIPVYQYFASEPQRYQYSIRSDIKDGWTNEGPAFYVLDALPE